MVIMKNTLLIASALTALIVSTPAAAITVDANLTDWGVTGAPWTPGAGINASIEDQTGSGAFYLNPGWGGQAYDAEALYTTIRDNKLYVALVTGHNPLTLNNPGGNSYGAGDFAFDFGKNGSYEAAINFNHRTGNNTYESTFVQGGFYQNATWNLGLWSRPGVLATNAVPADPSHPTSLRTGTLVGQAQLAYTTTAVNGHYFYEMSLDLGMLRTAPGVGAPRRKSLALSSVSTPLGQRPRLKARSAAASLRAGGLPSPAPRTEPS